MCIPYVLLFMLLFLYHIGCLVILDEKLRSSLLCNCLRVSANLSPYSTLTVDLETENCTTPSLLARSIASSCFTQWVPDQVKYLSCNDFPSLLLSCEILCLILKHCSLFPLLLVEMRRFRVNIPLIIATRVG